MVSRFFLLFALLLVSCAKLPGYGDTITVDEGGSVWEVRLVKAFHNENVVFVNLEYVNRSGELFSIRPTNLVLTDTGGNRWIADGRFQLLPLVQPGETKTLKASFANVAVTGKPLYLEPFKNLVHKEAKFLLKAEGGTPLPGNHENAAWDQAQ